MYSPRSPLSVAVMAAVVVVVVVVMVVVVDRKSVV